MVDESLLDGLPLLRDLNPAARREVVERSVLLRKGVGEVLWRAGEPARGLVILLTGRVRVVRVERRGRRSVIHREGPGATLGEVPLLDGGGYPATAEVEEPATALLLTPAGVDAALAADPAFARVLLGSLARRVRHLVERVEALTVLDVRSRLARHLLLRADGADGGAFSLGISQAALAEELGTVREVVVRNLAALAQRGAVVREGRGRYRIANRSVLEALAEP